MKDDDETQKLLRSIKSALWIIVAILLTQLGFHLADLRSTPFAEVVMLLGFWGGYGKDAPEKTLDAIRASIAQVIQTCEQAVAPNRSLPPSQKSTSPVRGPGD
jgi:hypothetical protein